MAVTNAAIVGIGCRVRGAQTAEGLWAELSAHPKPFARLPEDRWDSALLGQAPHAGLLDDYDLDFRAFRTPPVQLARMHRMERAAMAAMHGALLDAGLARPGTWSERAQIHIGASTLGFDPAIDHMARLRLPRTLAKLDQVVAGTPAAAAREAVARALDAAAPPISVDSLMTTASMAAGRVANAFDLGGGHLAYDCGASSSLAALAAAMAALDEGDCDVVIVASVSPLITPTVLLAHDRRGLLAPSGEITVSAEGASSGTVLAEGAIAIVLEREDLARSKNDRIYAVVRGVGVSSAGRRGSSQALAPCVTMASQRALEVAQVSLDAVDYIECQAAGLPSVDEPERRGLAAVYGAKWRPAPAPLATSAVHLGWLGAASGLASVVTAALAVAHGRRPLSGFLARPPGARGKATEFQPENGPIRCVGVSSPGLGGVVYHAVLASPEGSAPGERARATTDGRIAVVGMGTVMPGAPNLGAFWSTILTGNNAVGPLPPDPDEPPGPRAPTDEIFIGGLVPLRRDPSRLRAAPVSLPYIDGAVVLSVDACAQALEDAGFRGGAWDPTRVAVFTASIALRRAEFETERAMLAQSTLALTARALADTRVSEAEQERVLGRFGASLRRDALPLSEESVDCLTSFPAAARVAARYDFRGGALAVDGACASSLAAVHLAVRALSRGEIDVAVVSGTSYHVVPEYLAALRTLGVLAQSGSRPFDPEAEGMVPSEGAGAVVLKRYTDALRDRDRIYAVIAGSGISSDGRGAAVLAPNTVGQQRALARAYAAAQVAPTEIDLVEAHGTGTLEGDATELETYAAIFARRESARPIVLGSVKSNIGHLSSAAGMAGLIKCALSLHHRVLPPMRHRGELSPGQQAILGERLAITTEARPWSAPPNGAPRRAGVSAFGLGGVNSHVVIEEFLTVTERPSTRPNLPGKEGAPANVAQRLAIELVPLWRPRPLAPYPIAAGSRVLIAIDSARTLAKLADAVGAKLVARGARPLIWEAPDHASLPNLEARLRALDAEVGGIGGVVDLGTLAASTDRGVMRSVRVADSIASGQAVHTVRRAAAISRALYRHFEQASADAPPFFLAATGMGGTMGFFTGVSATAGGAIAGFLKGLKHDIPSLFVRAVDFDAREEPSFIAETLIAELSTGGDRVEVGYQNRRRFVPVLRLAPLSAKEIVPLPRQGAVLFSGGSRGVVFECARAMARHGLRAVITGRTPMPRGDERWLTMSDEELEALRREEMLIRRKKDPSLTPVRFAREWDPVVRARELARNLAAARASGEPIEYIACDVLDPDEVSALVGRVRARHGRIAGLVHGAMVEQSRSLLGKSFEVIDDTVRVKLLGLSHLLAATATDPLQFIAAFGSIAGRFGNRGQADYCAANDAMARSLARYAAEARPGVRCITIEWTGWKHLGSLSDPRTAEILEKNGVIPIEPDEGVRWFMNEITRGDRASTVIICAERQAQAWPFVSRVSDAAGLPPTELDDLGRPLVSGDHPLVDAVIESVEPGKLVLERTFGPARDLFLADHHVGETPVLPGAFAMELLAEAARLVDQGKGEVHELRNVALESPLRFARGDRTLRVRAEWTRTADGSAVVEVRASADVLLRGAVLEKGRTYYRGTVIVGPPRATDTEPAPSGSALTRPAATPAGDLPIAAPEGSIMGSLFERVTTPICLGARFLPIVWLKRSERSIAALVREPDETDLFSTTAAPRFVVDPMVLDAAFQVAANWDAYREGGWLSFPMSLDLLLIGARREPREARGNVRIEARLVSEDHPNVRYDVSVRGRGGKLLLELRGLVLHRLDPTPREALG